MLPLLWLSSNEAQVVGKELAAARPVCVPFHCGSLAVLLKEPCYKYTFPPRVLTISKVRSKRLSTSI